MPCLLVKNCFTCLHVAVAIYHVPRSTFPCLGNTPEHFLQWEPAHGELLSFGLPVKYFTCISQKPSSGLTVHFPSVVHCLQPQLCSHPHLRSSIRAQHDLILWTFKVSLYWQCLALGLVARFLLRVLSLEFGGFLGFVS